jgi:hypothetical protein
MCSDEIETIMAFCQRIMEEQDPESSSLVQKFDRVLMAEEDDSDRARRKLG